MQLLNHDCLILYNIILLHHGNRNFTNVLIFKKNFDPKWQGWPIAKLLDKFDIPYELRSRLHWNSDKTVQSTHLKCHGKGEAIF